MWDFSTGTLFMLKRAVEQGAPVSFFLIAFIGLCSGSFLSVVVFRLSTILVRMDLDSDGMPATSRFNIATPASHCRKCGHKIRWFENIPIISYVLMRAKCGSCGGKISIAYLALEFLMCMASIVALWQFWSRLPFPLGAILGL